MFVCILLEFEIHPTRILLEPNTLNPYLTYPPEPELKGLLPQYLEAIKISYDLKRLLFLVGRLLSLKF